MAGRVAHEGLVIALNVVLGVKGQKECRMMSIEMRFTSAINEWFGHLFWQTMFWIRQCDITAARVPNM